MMEDQTKKHIQTSKLILFISFACAIILSITTIVATFIGADSSNLATIAGIAWGEVAVHTAVYSLKAKTENRLKILLAMIKELSENDKFEPEIIVQLFDGVTKEG